MPSYLTTTPQVDGRKVRCDVVTYKRFFGAFLATAVIMVVGFVLCVVGKDVIQFIGVALLAVAPALAIGADLSQPDSHA